MDDYNNKQNGELNGFDQVTNENGYTVTPDGGFYTKSRDDIIQDEAYHAPEPNTAETENSNQQGSANAGGYYANNSTNYNYGGYNYGGTTFSVKPPKQKKAKKKGERHYYSSFLFYF